MELGVTVTGLPNRDQEDMAEPNAALRYTPSAGIDYGPCLYLGPAGQRCSRRANEGGFCELHRLGAKPVAGVATNPRRAIAILAALAALLPWLTDLVRELLRFFR
jgi:hypothetical protein